jgi:type I restriction enzyme M protein
MVECVRPEPMRTIADPACGTGGFFLALTILLLQIIASTETKNSFIKFNTFMATR